MFYKTTSSTGIVSIQEGGVLPPDGVEITEADYASAFAAMQAARDARFNPPVTLTDYAKEVRKRTELGGITVNGVKVATDDRSKLLISGLYTAAKEDPTFATVFQADDDTEHPLDATAIIAVYKAGLAHVAAVFQVYATVKAAIDAGSITTHAQVDAAFAATPA